MSKLDNVRPSLRSRIGQLRRKPLWIAGLAAAVLVVAAGAYLAIAGAPHWTPVMAIRDQLVKPTIAELVERTKRDPTDGGSHLQLGHAWFEAKKRGPAVREYERALVQDRKFADEQLLANLVSCFGTPEQGDAASVITRFKLVEIEPKLDDLATDARYNVRWGALQTLEKLGKASRSDFVNAWIRDLDSQKCELRQAAVEHLGNEGDKRALAAIRKAKKKDQENRGWFGTTCLGGRPDEAERKLLATK